MIELVLATRNQHKVKEISQILQGLDIKLLSLYDFKSFPEVIEDRSTLKENAEKKAREVAMDLGKWALADDTGLEVEYLGGQPGVYSARFAGDKCSYEDNNNKLLELLKGVPKEKRKADFRCVIAISDPGGNTQTADGMILGYITEGIKGKGGFGYDPLFEVPELNKTFAELTDEEKNKISHRSLALRNAKKLIEKIAVMK